MENVTIEIKILIILKKEFKEKIGEVNNDEHKEKYNDYDEKNKTFYLNLLKKIKYLS